MAVTVTDPDVALDGLQRGARRARRPADLPHIPVPVDRAGCPRSARRRQRVTLVPAFEVGR